METALFDSCIYLDLCLVYYSVCIISISTAEPLTNIEKWRATDGIGLIMSIVE